MKYTIVLLVIACVLGFDTSTAADDAGWINLAETVDVGSAVAGTWKKSEDGFTVDAVAGARIALAYQPTTEYDFRVRFTRRSGQHSVALIVPVPGGQTTFDIDAWGAHLAGFQNVGGRSLREQPSQKQITLENGREYTALVEVRADKIRASLDGELIVEQTTDGVTFDLPAVWRMPDARALGVAAYSAEAVFHAIEVRAVSGGEKLIAATSTPAAGSRKRMSPRERAASETTSTTAAPSGSPQPGPSRSRVNATGKRVLIVIANQDFYYREYIDPRTQLERAGIEVEVAAGRRAVCRPHRNSGEQGSGEVMPDLAIADVDPSRYDAIMFSGGWGSSMYQYSFPGAYRNAVYTGNRDIKNAVNEKLNQFVEQDKVVGALCHGISVLAWARVDGRSLLAGRRAVGSPRRSPAGAYPGLQQTPLSRWNVEANGARVTPMRSIGDPRTSADDVLVDGKLITGEDDNSAELFGRTLAQMLVGQPR